MSEQPSSSFVHSQNHLLRIIFGSYYSYKQPLQHPPISKTTKQYIQQIAIMPNSNSNAIADSKCPSPQPSAVIVPDDLLSGLSLSKASVAKSRNRALTATDFDNILCQL